VQRVLFRNDPILSCSNPARPPHTGTLLRAITRSAHVWEEMEKAGVPDVRGVWSHEPGPRQFTVIAIKQRYPGHAKQAAVIASQCFSGGYQNRFTIVVDDDIDPTRIDDVVWALSTRCDPEIDLDSAPLLVQLTRPDDSTGFQSMAQLARGDRRLPAV
jgi:4-hydroxy-3-polyprenylbenzoate decarboxylase